MWKLFAEVAAMIPEMIITVLILYVLLIIGRKIAIKRNWNEDIVVWVALFLTIGIARLLGFQ